MAALTITAPSGATIRGTFISPQGVRISYEKTATGGLIRAVGINDFFVVMTVQKETIPTVLVEGSGLDGTVTINNQRITFDGEKIILTQFEAPTRFLPDN